MKLNIENGYIDMTHGSGGRAMMRLIEQLFLSAFHNEYLEQKNDQAYIETTANRMVISTDAFVISPLFFPGGDIGCLAIHGTVNDVAMAGAKPLYLSASFILEEGLPLYDLKKIVDSMAEAAKKSDVMIVTGDTKVVERGKGDGVFITTTGFGRVPEGIHFSGKNIQPGDHVLLSGMIGDHGIAVMAHRHQLKFSTDLTSDTQPLNALVEKMVESQCDIRCLRDPTRGGVATTLNEWAQQSHVGFYIDENQVPIREEVASACELLGLDPFYIANEGKLLAVCSAENSDRLLQVMRSQPEGKDAQIIGHANNDSNYYVQLKTKFGGTRIMDWLSGEQLPRIC